jgi:molybdenum cofactor cytidylyltransferase
MTRSLAIVPAAGRSSRMGAPKLMLPLEGKPLIAHTIGAWRASQVDAVLVVVRPDDPELAAAARVAGAEVVVAEAPPPDMKASVQLALAQRTLDADGAFLVAPADMPRLSPAIVNRLLEMHRQAASGSRAILVPTLKGKNGHPVLFPAACAADVFKLPADHGLDALIGESGAKIVPCDDLALLGANPFADIDTPEQYARLRGE